MVDLSQFKKTGTLEAINSQTFSSTPRPYLGASAIGHECERYLWYAFRWCFREELTYRQMRLFDRGHREEPAIEKMLQSVGITCFGQQDEAIACYGHVMAHCDGKSLGVLEAPKTVHLNEFKTMNNKNFKDLCANGVKASKPEYFGQIQISLKMFKLTRSLFVSINKDNDAAYIERVYEDKEYGSMLLKKAEEIILSESPPERRFKSTWYACGWCGSKSICHGNEEVDKSCRTCESCNLLPQGKWECSKWGDLELSTSQQRLGCESYKLMESLR